MRIVNVPGLHEHRFLHDEGIVIIFAFAQVKRTGESAAVHTRKPGLAKPISMNTIVPRTRLVTSNVLIVIENDQNGHLGMKSVRSTIWRYHLAFWSTDTEALLRIKTILNALQYREGRRLGVSCAEDGAKLSDRFAHEAPNTRVREITRLGEKRFISRKKAQRTEGRY